MVIKFTHLVIASKAWSKVVCELCTLLQARRQVTYNFIEQDMNYMFWNIPKDEGWGTKSHLMHLSIAKQGLKHLDRHGKASSKDFFVLSKVELLGFVEYDIYYNKLFTII